MSILTLQLQKKASYIYQNIQDKFAINEANKSVALADGTTLSFHSETWAKLLTEQFVANPSFNGEKLISLFTECAQSYKGLKYTFSDNPAIASLEKTIQQKGGTAAFIGLQFSGNNSLNIINCGDTNLFILRNDIIDSYPYTNIDTLDSSNYFINTEELLNKNIDESYFQIKAIEVQNDAFYILATDALSRLLLKDPNALKELISINDFTALFDFSKKYWDKKEMEEDDISAIIITNKNINDIKQIFPPPGFSFPKEDMPVFIPTPTDGDHLNKFTTMQMNQIIGQFGNIANDFQQVKKKQKLHELLLMVAISLLMVNLILLILFLKASSHEKNKTKPPLQLEQKSTEKYMPINNLQRENVTPNTKPKLKDTDKLISGH